MKHAGIILGLFLAGSATAAEFTAGNADEVATALGKAKPGDTIVMTDGKWTDQIIDFKAKGSTDAPITLRADPRQGHPRRQVLHRNDRR